MLKLSLDIILVIFNFLDPFDILAIGQTCQTLRAWSSIRSVWIIALRRIVAANSLFKPVFDPQDLAHDPNLILQQMQYAATAPKRIVSLLERTQKKAHHREITPLYKNSIPLFDPHLTRDLSKQVKEMQDGEVEQELIFVPGGRFIIILSTSFGRLTVIDVERFFANKRNSGANSSSTSYSASSPCRNDRGVLRASVSDDETKLYIVMTETRQRLDMLYLWEYIPSSHSLTMTKTGLMWTPRTMGISAHHLWSNMFLYIAQDVLYIWDFINDKYLSWTIDIDYNVHSKPMIYLDGNHIIILETRNVKVWNIPPLVSAEPLRRETPSILYPPTYILRSCVSSIPNFREDGTIMPIDDWYNGPTHPLVFDMISWRLDEQEQEESALLRQRIDLPTEPETNDADSSDADDVDSSIDLQECIMLTRLQRLKVYEDSDVVIVHTMPSMMCDRRVVLVCCSEDALHTMCTPGPAKELPSDLELLPSELVSLGRREEYHDPQLYSFDPCSGRLCLVAKDGMSVIIWDYLQLPHSIEESRKTANLTENKS